MGVAIIIPDADFSAEGKNIGQITIQQDVSLTAISISGDSSITGSGNYTVGYTPSNTNQKGVIWSIESGSQYASIDSNGKLTAIDGASSSPVTIKATSSYDNTIVATKTVSVTFVSLTGLTITCESAIEAATFTPTVSYTPSATSQTGVVWSITSGSSYATINASTGVVTVLDTAASSNITIRATSSVKTNIYTEKTVAVTYPSTGNIVFADANVKSALASFDTSGDGEISTDEALVPTALPSFYHNTTITSFNELSKFKNIKTIVANGFNGCTSLTSINLVNITTIANNVFTGDTALTSVGSTANVISIGPASFMNCSGILSFDLSSCTSLGAGQFQGCTSLTTVNSDLHLLTALNGGTFQSCGNLTGNFVLTNIVTIGQNDFFGCAKLTAMTIGDKCTSIGQNAFLGCTALATLTILATTPPTLATSASFPSNTIIKVPSAALAAYKAASVWSEISSRIQAIS